MAAINSRDLFIQTIVPRLLSQAYAATDISIKLESTDIVVDLILPDELPKYIKTFSVKLWRTTTPSSGTSSTDWWGTAWDNDNMLIVNTLSTARFNLLRLPSTSSNRRISSAGVNYQIACRAVDTTDNLSSKSILGSILIKTIS
jgi:hypothetical protein